MSTRLPRPVYIADLLDDSLGSRSPRDLLVLLRWHSGRNGRCWHRQAALAEELGVTERTVRRWIDLLVEKGRVRVERDGRRLRYSVIDTADAGQRSPVSGNGDRTRASGGNRTGVSAATGSTTTQARSVPDGTGGLAPAVETTQIVEIGSSPARSTQALVAHFVDEARERGVEPPKRMIGQVARYSKQLLDEGQPYDRVQAGIDLMLDKGLPIPSQLASFVMQAALPPRARDSRHRRRGATAGA